MRRQFSLLLATVVAVTFISQLHAADHELLVKWQHGPESEEARAGNAAVGSAVKRTFSAIGWQLVRLPDGVSVSEGMAKYKSNPEVLAVEPNGPLHFAPPPPPDSAPSDPELRAASITGPVTPNDPRWSSQWNMRKIGMPAAWAVTTGSSNVVVAVLDTGVDYTHEDLRDNMWRNPGESGLDSNGNDRSTNGIDDDGNGYVDDLHGIDTFDNDADPMDPGVTPPDNSGTNYHGTACAGIIGASGNNSTGIAGVCWSVRLMAVRLPLDAGTRPVRKSAYVEGFEYVIMERRRGVNIRVINNSWGGLFRSEAILDAINVAGTEGILSVFAAMNEAMSTDNQWFAPSCYDSPYIVSVANVDSSDVLAPRSNFGRSTVDLAAPGRLIDTLSANNGQLSGFSGTSAACPHVVGAVALLCSVRPEATPLELKGALMQSVDPLSTVRGRVVSNGRLNVARALGVLTNSSLPPIILSAFPASSHTSTNALVEIRFNASMDRSTVEAGLQFSPAISGTIEWSDSDRVLRLRPDAPLKETNYTARILGTARGSAGKALDGDFDRTSEGSPAHDFVWSFRFAPANDAFANAAVLTGVTGSLRDNNTNSSTEEDEPLLVTETRWTWGPSLWYRWQAPNDGWMTFDASASNTVDTIVSAYTGEKLSTLVELGRGDDFGGRKGGRVSFPVQASSNYFIRLGGTWSSTALEHAVGSFTLSWYPTPPPGFTGSQFIPTNASPGARITLTGTNFTGVADVLFNGARANFTNWAGDNGDRRLTAFVPLEATSGPITIQTPHGKETTTGSFTVLPAKVTAPSVIRVTSLASVAAGNSSTTTVFFDEELEQTSAESVSNYSIDSGAIAISSAVLRPDLKSVLLSTAPLVAGAEHLITIRSVTDRFRNTISELTQTFHVDNEVLHLTFDDPSAPGSNVAGHSGDGTLIEELLPALGISGNALGFDGVDDYIEIPYSTNLGITGDITIAAWVKRETFAVYHGIVAKTRGRNSWDYDLYFGPGADTLRFWSDDQSPQEAVSTGSVANRSWNHVAVIRRGQTVTFYINGKPAGTVTVTGNFPDRRFPVLIGTENLNIGQTTMFKGLIDDVRIYNQALSTTEIRKLSSPPLGISWVGTELSLSWPTTGAGFLLETSENLNSAAWTRVAETPTVQNGVSRITQAAPAANRFYRLRAP